MKYQKIKIIRDGIKENPLHFLLLIATVHYMFSKRTKGSDDSVFVIVKCTLNTSLTAVISSGPTPSPGTIVTLKVASARAGGASGPQRPADTLNGRVASCCHRGPLRPWGQERRHSQQAQHGIDEKHCLLSEILPDRRYPFNNSEHNDDSQLFWP